VKVIPIVQFPPATTELPQVSAVSAKSLELPPPIAKLVMLRTALPVLLKEMICKELTESTGTVPKARLLGERLTPGLAPVPERTTVCGLPLALSATLTAAVKDPLADGVKVTLIVQLPPAVTLAPQLLLCAKAPGFAPVSAIPVILKAPLPVSLNVTVWAALVAPTAWLPKARLLADITTEGDCTTPVPDRAMLKKV
jgi:hypothetical protein